MPRHDLPDGSEAGDNVVDFRDFLSRRVERTARDSGARESELSDWELFSRAEYETREPAKFNRYDILLLGMIVAVIAIFWIAIRR